MSAMKQVVACLLALSSLPTVANGFLLPSTFKAREISTPGFLFRKYEGSSQSGLGLSTIPFPNSLQPRTKKTNNVLSSAIRRLRRDEVACWRVAAFTFISSLLTFRHAIDVKLSELWTYLMTSSSLPARIFRTDSYEWILAVIAFNVYIHAYLLVDRAIKKASDKGEIHPWRKYRLQDRYEADKRRRMIERLNRASDTRNEISNFHVEPAVDTKLSEWNWKGYLFELWVYVLPLLTWDIVSPRRHRRLAPFLAPTTIRIMRDVTFSLLLYDILFFCGHILMHKVPFIYRTIHAKHHKVKEVRSGDVVRLSLVAEVIEVSFSIIAINLLSAHPMSRSIYNCVITFLLTELHCGYDFPWTPQNVVPFGLATGSRRHHYHHRNGKHYYQKFFHHVDRLFGSYQPDDGTLQGDSVKANPNIPPSWI